MSQDPTQRFTDRADAYARFRPTYPGKIIDFFRNDLHLTPQTVVADVGAGTGLLTQVFLKNGNTVHAIEPNDSMRRHAETSLAGYPGFQSHSGTAEQTGLANHSIGMVTAGQAFHWFHLERARVEFKRILVEDGYVALVWNERRHESPFARDYRQLLRDFAVDGHVEHHRRLTDNGGEALKTFFGPAGFQVRTFDNPQSVNFDGLRGRFNSSSYSPSPDHLSYGPAMEQLRIIFDKYQFAGQVTIDHDTRIYWGHLT